MCLFISFFPPARASRAIIWTINLTVRRSPRRESPRGAERFPTTSIAEEREQPMSSRDSEARLEEELRTRQYRCRTFVILSIPALRRYYGMSCPLAYIADCSLQFRVRQYANTTRKHNLRSNNRYRWRQTIEIRPCSRDTIVRIGNPHSSRRARRRAIGDFSSSGYFLDLFDFPVRRKSNAIASRDNAAGGAKLMNIADRISLRCNSI